MPAPLAAKGIILLSSILVAAGLAAYENPEVRAWIQERRRKIALAYNEFVDEFDRPRPARRRPWHEDASMREDPSAEAAERREKARQESLEKGIILRKRQNAAHERQLSASSFDELVDEKGKLLVSPDKTISTALGDPANNVLRNRSANTGAFIPGSHVANPFTDETGTISSDSSLKQEEQQAPVDPGVPSDIPWRHRMATSLVPAASMQNHSEETQLTPTTSAAASTLASDAGILTPTSAHDALSGSQHQTVPIHQYQSIQEWASAASSGPESFYSPPESTRHDQVLDTDTMHTPSHTNSRTASLIGTNDGASEGGDLGIEALSDSGADTPYTWSEIGSQVSGED